VCTQQTIDSVFNALAKNDPLSQSNTKHKQSLSLGTKLSFF
jgi:hypothetical protein